MKNKINFILFPLILIGAPLAMYFMMNGSNPFATIGIGMLVGSFVIGIAVAFAVTGTFKAQLKSVSAQSSARFYMEQGSMKLTTSKELFLGSHTVRQVIQNNNHGGGRGGHRGGGHRGGGGRGRR